MTTENDQLPKKSGSFFAFLRGTAKGSTSASAPAPAPTGPKKRKKLGRNLMTIGMVMFIIIVVGVQLVRQGGNLEDAAVVAQQQKAKDDAQTAAYDKRVEDPEARATEFEQKVKAGAGSKPSPGTPLPTDADKILSGDEEGMERALRAIESRSKGRSDSARSTTAGATSLGAQSTAETSDGTPPPPSFVSYAVKRDEERRGLIQAPKSAAAGTSDGPTTASELADANAARKAAYAAQQQQLAEQAGSGGTPTPIGDSNNAWLAQRQGAARATTIKARKVEGARILYPGTVIKGVLDQALDTQLPGSVRAHVTSTVYDSRNGTTPVLFPGDPLFGAYRNSVSDGQVKVLMAFDSVFTDELEVPLGNMSASDALGVGGVPGELHTHVLKRLGIATLLAIEAVGVERAVGSTNSTYQGQQGGSATSTAAGQLVLQTANQELQRQYAVPPNITINPGKELTIIVTNTIELPPLKPRKR